MEASCTPVESPVKVELLTGRAVWGSDEILLSEQNWVFICALARCYHPASREQLEAILWPDATREQAENLFSVGLHRLRRRLGAGVVIQSADGYRLGDNVVVDLWEIEALSNAHELPDAETQTVERWLAIYRRIACGCTRSSGLPMSLCGTVTLQLRWSLPNSLAKVTRAMRELARSSFVANSLSAIGPPRSENTASTRVL